MALLTLKDIGKIYVSEGSVSVGIRGVNLSFNKGEFVAVTGKSGSGKSTLLNVISGMDTYEEGELFIEDQPTSHYMQQDWEEYREKYISFIFQDYNIIESFTVLQNVELALMHIDDKKERRKRAMELLRRVGMTSHIRQKGSSKPPIRPASTKPSAYDHSLQTIKAPHVVQRFLLMSFSICSAAIFLP